MTICQAHELVPASGLQLAELASDAVGAQAGRPLSASPGLGPSALHLPSQLPLPAAASNSETADDIVWTLWMMDIV